LVGAFFQAVALADLATVGAGDEATQEAVGEEKVDAAGGKAPSGVNLGHIVAWKKNRRVKPNSVEKARGSIGMPF
jgi:uncharacterized protein (AIM24 family)